MSLLLLLLQANLNALTFRRSKKIVFAVAHFHNRVESNVLKLSSTSVKWQMFANLISLNVAESILLLEPVIRCCSMLLVCAKSIRAAYAGSLFVSVLARWDLH